MASPSAATAEARSSGLRAAARIAALGLWFLFCLPPHLIARAAGRSKWPRRFLAGAARICGAEVACTGEPILPGTLIVANHLSWLDIPVLAAATGCAFISKAEIRDQPLLGWLANHNHTLYVDRAERRAVHGQAERVRDALRRGQPLALFPEGTVGHGGRLLPFKPSLLAAVAPPPEGVAIRPAAIDYGALTLAIGWAPGEAGVKNALRILRRKGRIRVTVRLLDPLEPTGDRKALARAAHDAIATALAPSGIVPARV